MTIHDSVCYCFKLKVVQTRLAILGGVLIAYICYIDLLKNVCYGTCTCALICLGRGTCPEIIFTYDDLMHFTLIHADLVLPSRASRTLVVFSIQCGTSQPVRLEGDSGALMKWRTMHFLNCDTFLSIHYYAILTNP